MHGRHIKSTHLSATQNSLTLGELGGCQRRLQRLKRLKIYFKNASLINKNIPEIAKCNEIFTKVAVDALLYTILTLTL